MREGSARNGPLALEAGRVVLEWLQYAIVRSLLGVLRTLPVEFAYRTARSAARAWYRLDARHRAVALEGLRTAFGDGLTPSERDRIARLSYEHFACLAIDLAHGPRFVRPETALRHIRVESGDDVLDWIGKSGRGAIFATAHFGSWEIVGMAAGLRGFPLQSIARPLDNRFLDRWLLERRQRFGQRIVAKKGAAREVATGLREGGYLGLLVDQNAGRRGVFVPFFGRLASTSPAAAIYALRHRVPIVPACGWRESDDFRFAVSIDRPIVPREGADPHEEVLRLTAEMTQKIEAFVRAHPEQYLWVHRRWKTRPEEVPGAWSRTYAPARDPADSPKSAPAGPADPSGAGHPPASGAMRGRRAP